MGLHQAVGSKQYSYKDVTLYSNQISNIKSRENIDVSTEIMGKKLRVPILVAPMFDIYNEVFLSCAVQAGVLPVMHRFWDIEKTVGVASVFYKDVVFSIGINDDYLDRFDQLSNIGVEMFCLDVANSSTYHVVDKVLELTSRNPSAKFMVGNTMSKNGVLLYKDIPSVHAIRVGVAGGSACSTKNATGMWRPEISLMIDCRSDTNMQLVADGGVREPSDMCKAIVAGADAVMMGGVFAAAHESAATLTSDNGKFYKMLRGSASYEIQEKYKNIPKYIEGKNTMIPYKGESVSEIVDSFVNGLKSSMSYANATDFNSYRNHTLLISSC